MNISEITQWLGFAGIVILGIVGILGLFDQAARKRRKEGDETEDRVISLLKEEVAKLRERIEEAENWKREAELRVERVITENKTLREILQGKDKTSVEYQKEGREAIKKVAAILEVTKANTEQLKTQNDHIERLATSIEKLIDGGSIKTVITKEVRGNG